MGEREGERRCETTRGVQTSKVTLAGGVCQWLPLVLGVPRGKRKRLCILG